MILWKILFSVALLQAIAGATPTVTYPINAQVPPVARVSEHFSYSFSASTFSSDQPITYTLSDAPSWLSLDGSTRTLSGTPEPSDAGSDTITAFAVELTATDQTGFVTLNSTLVISKNPAPKVNIPLSAQLPTFGTFAAPSTIIVQESSAFDFKFKADTFSESQSNIPLFYYAVTNANTPLPSWLEFNPLNLSLSGQTPNYPSLVGIQIVASDVQGFSGSSVSFEMAVGIHTLSFNNSSMLIDAMPGTEVSFTGLANNIQLDGQLIDASKLASITVQTPSWLNFDNSTLVISGHTPPDATPYNITVHATDIYGDAATASVLVDIGAMSVPATASSTGPHATTLPVSGTATAPTQLPKKLIAAIVLPIALLALVGLAALICYRRRRRTALEEYRRPFSREKLPFPANPNAQDIIGLAPPVPPKCLRLDALRYVENSWRQPHVLDYSGEKSEAHERSYMERQSVEQTGEGSFNSTALVPNPLDIPGAGARSRAGTASTLHRSKASWGSTITSIFPTVRSRTNSSSRQASNYSPCSERGRTKRSGRMWSPDQDYRNMHSFGHRSPESVLNSRDSNISFGAMINFPILSEVPDSQERGDPKPSAQRHAPVVPVTPVTPVTPIRRRSRSLPSISRLYLGNTFGRPESMTSLERGGTSPRYGNSQESAGGNRWSKTSSSWITPSPRGATSQRACSLDLPEASARLGKEAFYQDSFRHTREPFIPYASLQPEVNLVERKFSSRRSGASPFFGAPSIRRPRKLSEQGTTTSADVTAYPKMPIDPQGSTISGVHRESRILPEDAAETSLWSAREGTRQLKDYLQNLLRRTWNQDSVYSENPSYSLFGSARGSVASVQPIPSTRGSQESEVKRGPEVQRRETLEADAGSDWSWETHCTPHDDQETVIEDWPHDSPATELGTVVAGSSNMGSPTSDMGLRKARAVADGQRHSRTEINGRSMEMVCGSGDRYGGEMEETAYI